MSRGAKKAKKVRLVGRSGGRMADSSPDRQCEKSERSERSPVSWSSPGPLGSLSVRLEFDED